MANQITPETVAAINKFVWDRNWDQFHNPKDLAISLNLEAAELLEIFQWSGEKTMVEGKEEKFREELADVLIYAVRLSEKLGLNMDEIIQAKLELNNKKYDVKKAYGSAKKYTEL